MKKISAGLKSLLVMLMAVMVIAGCSGNSAKGTDSKASSNGGANAASDAGETKKDVKVGIVFTVAGLGGESFNDLAFAGVKKAAEDLKIKYDYVEPKSVSDEEITLDEMASSKEYDLIISVGFEQVDALKVVAKNYPDQKFALIDAKVDLPNVANYASKEEEGSFLIGALSALVKNSGSVDKLTKDKVLGFIGGVESPLINKFAAGYTAGARYIDPSYKVLVDYVGGFNDPSTAKVIAETMNSQKADLIFHAAGASGMGLFQAAEEKKFVAIGVNSNQNKVAPDYIMASMLKQANQAAYDVIKSVVDGKFNPGVNTLGLKEGGVGYTLDKSNIKVPDEIVKKVEALKEKIVKGELKVPAALDQVEDFVKNNKYTE